MRLDLTCYRKQFVTTAVFASMFAFHTLGTPAHADFMVVPPNRTTAKAILYGRAIDRIANAFEQVRTIYAAKSSLGVDIATARQEFWGNIDQQDGYDDRYAELLKLLLAKDYLYLMAKLPEGTESSFGQLFAGFGGDVDGGIAKSAASAFDAWVRSIRQHFGRTDGQMLVVDDQQLLVALDSPSVLERYRIYQMQRDRDEFRQSGYLAYFDKNAITAIPAEDANTPVILKGPKELFNTPEGAMGSRRWYEYSQVPELFVPDIAPDMNDPKAGWIKHIMTGNPFLPEETPKHLVNTLKQVEGWHDVFGDEFRDKYNKDNKRIVGTFGKDDFDEKGRFHDYMEEKYGIDDGPGKPGIIQCVYGTFGNWKTVVGWYGKVPDFSDAPDRKKFRPFEMIGAMESCPAYFNMEFGGDLVEISYDDALFDERENPKNRNFRVKFAIRTFRDTQGPEFVPDMSDFRPHGDTWYTSAYMYKGNQKSLLNWVKLRTFQGPYSLSDTWTDTVISGLWQPFAVDLSEFQGEWERFEPILESQYGKNAEDRPQIVKCGYGMDLHGGSIAFRKVPVYEIVGWYRHRPDFKSDEPFLTNLEALPVIDSCPAAPPQ